MAQMQPLSTGASSVKGRATTQGNSLILEGSPVSNGDVRRGWKEFDGSDLDFSPSILGLPASGSTII